MKTHLEIAKELWKQEEDEVGNNSYLVFKYSGQVKQHAQDCEMFLEFLKKIDNELINQGIKTNKSDLINTLKFYKEKGVIE